MVDNVNKPKYKNSLRLSLLFVIYEYRNIISMFILVPVAIKKCPNKNCWPQKKPAIKALRMLKLPIPRM